MKIQVLSRTPDKKTGRFHVIIDSRWIEHWTLDKIKHEVFKNGAMLTEKRK